MPQVRSIVVSTTTSINTSVTVDYEVKANTSGVSRTWPSVGNAAAYMFKRVSEGRALLDIPGSDTEGSGIDVLIETNAAEPEMFNSVLYAMKKAWHKPGINRTDGKALADEFESIFGYPLFSDVRGKSVFLINTTNGPAMSVGAGSSRSTPVVARTGSIVWTKARGTVKEVRDIIADPVHRADIKAIFDQYPKWRIQMQDKDLNWFHTSTEQSLWVIDKLSCIFLGLWLRCSKSPVVDLLLKKLQVKVRNGGKLGTKNKNSHVLGSKFVWTAISAVAKHRDVDPYALDEHGTKMYESCMEKGVKDIELFSIAVVLEVDIHVFQIGDYRRYQKLIKDNNNNKKDSSTAIVDKADIKALQEGQTPLKGMMRFDGRVNRPGRHKSDSGYKVAFCCHDLLSIEAHAEFVLDPVEEAHVFGVAYTYIEHKMTFDNTLDNTARNMEGYHTRLIAEQVVSPLVAKTVYALKEQPSFTDIVSERYMDRPMLIDNTEDIDKAIDNMIVALANLVDESCGESGVDFASIGKLYYLDVDALAEYAASKGQCDFSTGMRYVMAEVYKRLEARSLLQYVDLSIFGTVNPKGGAAELFRSRAEKGSSGPCYTSFSDLNMFSAVLLRTRDVQVPPPPSLPLSPFAIAEAQVAKRNKRTRETNKKRSNVTDLITFRTYSKKDYDESMIWVNANTSTIKTIATNMKKEHIEKSGMHTIEVGMEADKLFEDVTSDEAKTAFAMAVTGVGAFNLTLSKRHTFFPTLNLHCGFTPAVIDGVIHAADTNIHEPPPSIAEDRHRTNPTRIKYELDFVTYFPNCAIGQFIGLFQDDFYGQKPIFACPNRAVRVELEPGEFIGSQEAHLGYVFLSDIDHAKLRTHAGYTVVDSWRQFAADNESSLNRFVPCSSIIELTAIVAKRLQAKFESCSDSGVRPWLYEYRNDRGELWNAIQRIVFNFKDVWLHHEPDKRKLLLRGYKASLTCRPGEKNKILADLAPHLLEPSATAAMNKLKIGWEQAYQDQIELYVNSGMSTLAARKLVKSGMNTWIGATKFGRYKGGLQVLTKQDMTDSSMTIDGKRTLHIDGIPFHDKAETQCAVRELPGTDKVLVEMRVVSPVAVYSFPSWFRTNALETARLVMDILVGVSDAYMSNTDAVFFAEDKLEDVLGWVHKNLERKMLVDGEQLTVDHIKDAHEQCKAAGCPTNKFCREHSLVDTDESTMKTTAPVKIIVHPGFVAQEVDEFEEWIGEGGPSDFEHIARNARTREECMEPSDMISVQPMTAIGRVAMQQAVDASVTPTVMYTSEFSPDMDKMAELGMIIPSDGQTMGDDPTPGMDDPLRRHCHLWDRGSDVSATVYIGDEGEAQPVTVDLKRMNELYTSNLVDQMKRLGNFRIEGFPGNGKTYISHKLIKDLHASEPDALFVAMSSTHQSLAAFKSLETWEANVNMDTDIEKRIFTFTCSSGFGVYKDAAECSQDPRTHMSANETKFKAKLGGVERKKNRGTLYIFVDEYEMLPISFESFLLFSSTFANTKTILIGDKMQTAAIGTGIRCDGDAVNTISDYTTIVFDLPFRNPDYEWQQAHHKAVHDSPTMFLEQPLSNYVYERNRDAPAVSRLLQETVDAWVRAKEEGRLCNDRMIATSNHKVGGMITQMILNLLPSEYVPSCDYPFVGYNSFSYAKGDGDPNLIEVEDGATAPLQGKESYNAKRKAEDRYAARSLHSNGKDDDPSQILFYNGTLMMYKEGFTYRAIDKFDPHMRPIVDGKATKRDRIGKGYTMRLVTLKTEQVTVATGGKKRGRFNNDTNKTETIKIGVFEGERGEEIVLRMDEMQAYIYYPFCLYSGAVVGHTYDQFTYVHMSNNWTTFEAYAALKPWLERIQRTSGDVSYMHGIVKTLNVCVSRTTQGNQANILELGDGCRGFWRKTLLKSKWHAVSYWGTQEYKRKLREWRNISKRSNVIMDTVE